MTKKKKNKTGLPAQVSINQSAQTKQVARTHVRAISYHSPIPPPEILKNYDMVVPGAADRILLMAERQSAHRQDLEKRVIISDIKDARLGLWLGFLIGMAAIIGGVASGLLGKEITGAFIGGTGVIGLTSVFVYGSVTRRKERETKSREIEQAGTDNQD